MTQDELITYTVTAIVVVVTVIWVWDYLKQR